MYCIGVCDRVQSQVMVAYVTLYWSAWNLKGHARCKLKKKGVHKGGDIYIYKHKHI